MNTDAELLAALRGIPQGSIGERELADRLGLSRAALRARIQELRGLGYDIEASPHRGYRLVCAPDLLHADDLLARLGKTRVIGRDIQVFRETTSTNDVVEKLARDGVKEGVAVFAEAQTRGRGRLGRKWLSPAGKGLWFSILLRPQLRAAEATQIMVAAATALARAIASETGLEPEIKWPNDLLLRGRKVAGILTELSAELDRIKYLILGIGVDVNLSARDFAAELRRSATSLSLETGSPLDRAALAAAMLRELDHDYACLGRGEFAVLADQWENRCSTLGRQVVIRIGDRKIEGRAEALDAEGALLVRTQHGQLTRITGGDVTLEK